MTKDFQEKNIGKDKTTMGEDRITKEQMRNEKSKILIMEASYSISQRGNEYRILLSSANMSVFI